MTDLGADFVARVLAAVFNLSLGIVYLVTWIEPGRFGGKPVRELVIIFLIEFIANHSNAFLTVAVGSPAPRWRKVVNVSGLLLFYAAFVAGFTLQSGDWWPLVAFVVLNAVRFIPWCFSSEEQRLINMHRGPDGRRRFNMDPGWAFALVMYLLCVFLTVLVPFPRLGVTHAVVAAQEFKGGGLWIESPHRVMAAGAIYFFALAWFEAFRRGKAKMVEVVEER